MASRKSSDSVRVASSSGVKVTLAPWGARPVRRGVTAGAAAKPDTAFDVLIAALSAQELEPVRQLTIKPEAAAATRRGATERRGAKRKQVAVDVDVAANESAVVLVEQDGEYSWHFPNDTAKRADARRGAARRRGAAAAAPRAPATVRIEVNLPNDAAPGGAARRGISARSIFKAAKGVVLKFAARTVAGASMKFLERNVKKGLVVMDGDDAAQWRTVERLSDLQLPATGTLNILLFVHGTFSSTAGSFGALTMTADGRALLNEARDKYHAVLGFDHATLSEDPQENALDLIDRLGRFQQPMHIDTVTFSRGGLVFRSLVEHLLPSAAQRPELGPAIFVGVPNNGTLLAEPENWKTLINLYTNLAAGSFALLGTGVPAARIVAGMISGVGAFAKYLADAVVTDKRVPGLAAQSPSGDFVRALNEVGAGQPIPDSCRYLAVTSNFDPQAALNSGKPIGIAASLLTRLANGLIDRLMKESNDLVVNDALMKQIDPAAGNFIDAELDFGDSPVVYHTVYFAQPQVAQQLRGWLLDEAARTGMMARHGSLRFNPSPRSPFTRVRFSAGDNVRRGPQRAEPPKPTTIKRAEKAVPLLVQWDDEAVVQAAQQCIKQLFGIPRPPAPLPAAAPAMEASTRGALRRSAARAARTAEVAAPGSKPRNYAPTLVPHAMQRSAIAPGREIRVMSFTQTHAHIPIFGTRAVVELDQSHDMVASSAKLARVEGVSPVPALTPSDALAALAKYTKMPAAARNALQQRTSATTPELTFYHDRERDSWHLAFVFTDVPVAPPSSSARKRGATKRTARDGHGMGKSPRQRFPMLDYLVDAHDGSVVYYYSVAPTASATKKATSRKRVAKKRSAAKRAASAIKALPGMCRGVDDENNPQMFFGLAVGAGFHLVDPQRAIRTFDLSGGDIDEAPLPPAPITSNGFDFGASSTAGVSAHVNSTHVFDFFNNVLLRKGIDDKGMDLVNVVNVTLSVDEPPPNWNNAVWWKKRMWYGRVKVGSAKFKSYARHLDIIGHELTHGVTETTSNLVYRDEAGALNESFSDIFGVIINNLVRKGATSDPRNWDWRLGIGLAENGGPLRNIKNPRATGDPDHTRNQLRLEPGELPNDDNDYGFVHSNSNIHNKAAYHVLTAVDKSSRAKTKPLIFQPQEVARLYYFTLQRLDRVATFEDVLDTLLEVTSVVYPDPAARTPRLAAIKEAYKQVGIPR